MADPSYRVTLIAAVLGVIGTLGAAVIQNWEKIVSAKRVAAVKPFLRRARGKGRR